MDNDIKQAYQKSLSLGADPQQALKLAQQIQTQRQSQRGGLTQQTFSQGYSRPNNDQNFFEAVAGTFTRPIERAVKTAGEAVNVLSTPGMVKSAFGGELTPEEQEAVAGYKPKFVREEEIKDQGTILKEGTKTVAGLASLAIPTGKTLKTAAILGGLEGGLRAYSEDQNILQGATGGAAGQIVTGVVAPKVFNWLRKPKIGKITGEMTKTAQPTVVSGGKVSPAELEIDDVTNSISPDLRFYAQPDKRAFSYADIWTVPTKRAKDLQPQRTAQFFIDHDMWKTPIELDNIANRITGRTGLVSGTVRKALKEVGDVEVPITETVNVLDEGLQMYVEIDDAIAKKLKDQLLAKTMSDGDNVVLPASRVFELAQQFERLGSQYANKANYLTDNVRMEQMGDLYKGMAATLVKSLDDTVGEQEIMQGLVTDKLIKEIADVTGSPKYAQELASDLSLLNWRKLQAPFVRASQLNDLTEQASMSAAQKLGNKLSIGGLIKSIPGVDTATEVAGSVAKPYVGKAASETKARAILAGAKALGKVTGEGAQNVSEDVATRTAMKGVDVISKTPPHQIAIENALNEANKTGDYSIAKSLLDKIPEGDAYKKSMTNLINGLSGETAQTGVGGIVSGARATINKALPTTAGDVLSRSAVSNLGTGVLGVNTQTQPVEAATGQTEYIQSSTGETLIRENGNIYSQDKQWVWNPQNNDWMQNPEATQDGYSQDMFRQALIQDLQTTGGKNVDKIIKVAEFMGTSGGGKQSQQNQAKLQSIAVAKNIVSDYSELLNELGGGYGFGGARVLGTIRNWSSALGLDPATATYADISQATSSLVARSLGETGVLNDKDIQRAQALIPKNTDSDDERKRKLAALNRIFNYVEQSVIATPKAQNSIEDMLINQRGGL